MSIKDAAEYFSKLLNKSVHGDTAIALSSAQKSQAYNWMIDKKIAFDESVLLKRFTINQLINSKSNMHSNVGKSIEVDFDTDFHSTSGFVSAGIDIQRMDEIFPNGLPFDPKDSDKLKGIFTTSELSYAQSKEYPEETLTGIFCAKEAIQKASNVKLKLNKIEVLPDKDGRPTSPGYSLSISHSGDYAIAIALTNTVSNSNSNLHTTILKSLNKTNENLKNEIIPSYSFNFRWLDVVYVTLIAILYYHAYL